MNPLKDLRARWKYALTAFVVLAAIISGGTLWALARQESPLTEFPGDNDEFRNLTIQFVRTAAENYFNGKANQYPDDLKVKGDWKVNIAIYHQGEIKGESEGKGNEEILPVILEEATRNALKEGQQNLNREDIKEARFMVSFPDQDFSFIEYDGEGKELIENLVITRHLDKEQIIQNIEQGKEFLLRAENKDEHGFYKKYDTLADDFGSRVHTVYSASIIYTLLKIYDYDQDERILEGIPDWADFLLSMQSKEEETYGAFHYSYYFKSEEKQPRFVVGTTALSIFTLLDLHSRTGDSRYLEAAKLGGDWLITMQKPDGWMKAHKEYKDEEWVYGERKSLLYNGQVLASLSRLYNATGEKRYYDAAEKIARCFTEKVEKEGCYLGDDYRAKNPISSAWVVMSLLDFYKVNPDEYYKDIILRCSAELLEKQQQDTDKPLYYGTWERAYSTSGNGWLAEVMVEVYRFCQEQNMDGCNRYKEALMKVTWWIIQNTYSEANTFFLKEPQKAIGGSFWNYENLYVRTDSVCHAVNACVGIINDLDDGILLSIPE